MSYSKQHRSEPVDRSIAVIAAIVIALHFVLISWAALTSSAVKPPAAAPPRRLVVQTVALNPTKTVASTREIAANRAPPAPVAEPVIEEVVPEAVEVVSPVEQPAPEKVEAPKPKLPAPTSAPIEMPTPEKTEPKKAEPKKAEPKKIDPKKVEPKKIVPDPKKPEKAAPAVPKKNDKPVSTPKPAPKAEPAKEPVKKVKDETSKKEELKKVEKGETDKQAKVAAEKKEAEKKETEKLAAEVQRKKEVQQQAAKEAVKAKQQELLAQAQERIAKIGQGRDKLTATKSGNVVAAALPSAIVSLQIDELPPTSGGIVYSERESSYVDELAGRLKLMLKLPEYGQVKIKLTLNRTGKVIKVVVLSAESAANRKHIEKMLPNLTFPGFGKSFSGSDEYTFAITLSNEL